MLAAAAAVGAVLLTSSAGATIRVGTTCFGQPATIVGTDGVDTLRGTDGNDVIVAGDGSDIIFGGAGDDLICGEGGDDIIFGAAGNDQIDGGPGNNSIDPGDGDDHVVGGDGSGQNLIAFLDATGPVTASLVTGTATGQGNDTFSAFDTIIGGPFNDTLTGNSDDFNALGGGPGDDIIDGGPGFDGTLFSTGPVTANLTTGVSSGADGNDTLRNMEGLEGTAQDDNFTGSADTNVLDGRGGNDILNGLGGTDLLQGDAQVDENPGNDVLNGGLDDDFLQPSPGNDTLDGGPGRLDMLDFSIIPTGVTANLATGKLTGRGIGNMKIVNVEGLFGSPANDTLIGDKGPNFLLGNGGTDHLFGQAGDDFLNGGDGNDTFDGGPGQDYCLDGKGKGCEFSGTPTASSRTASVDSGDLARMDDAAARIQELRAPGSAAARPFAPTTVSANGDNSEIGVAGCVGSTSRAARGIKGAGAERRRTDAGPPHKAPAVKGNAPKSLAADFVPAWLAGPLDSIRADAGQLTWQGTLFRYDTKRKAWTAYKKTIVAFGQVDPSGTAIWAAASGKPVDEIEVSVPAGQFAWKAVLRVPGAAPLNDWIEPHTDFARRGGGIYAPQCTFS